ncbi:glucoamylase family protein [Marinoscillum furvescens]|uniref:Glycoamylase-like domain-containing protein n=1 Tax=Marinoscillum furvescens DSM 4134 TaxID=1122208 RepID=A0A3D9KZU6_MARFU|nr:glucoamylase family protein [Marinoscillum furvescens]RED96178.1 hypothetical protein C7460_11569 [Marinoscillum furvescens DSM 4134]
MKPLVYFTVLFLLLHSSCKQQDEVEALRLENAFLGDVALKLEAITEDAPVDRSLSLVFSAAINQSSAEDALTLTTGIDEVDFTLSFPSPHSLTLRPTGGLQHATLYTLQIQDGFSGTEGQQLTPTTIQFRTIRGELVIQKVVLNGQSLTNEFRQTDVARDLEVVFDFSVPVSVEDLEQNLKLSGAGSPSISISISENEQKASVASSSTLAEWNLYELSLSDDFTGLEGEPFGGWSLELVTELDSTPVFPEMTDDELLTLIQQQTFKYFWDFAHPVSGLARERNTSGETVTTGGSGFGLMAILVGIERGFITRAAGVERLQTIVNFLADKAERFHGVWPHWLNGTTGKTRPFSTKDDGGDLVETSFLMQGLLTVRQYLDATDTEEASIIATINQLWHGVEWEWYTKGGENVLYWHWSETYDWEMNHKIQGWNESLITYVLAAASPTHGISKEVYTQGWARGGNMVNGQSVSHFGYTMPLRSDRGGPLFFSHYSFFGLDPRNLIDQYANYWDQNVNHSKINHAYCAANPKQYIGYKSYCWGLTASDNHEGYNAHSPDNDLGVITPTAAVSSIPYTPEESMAAIRHFYYIMGDELWGEYGFYDAFNVTENWTASSYLAIDQGPIVIMIENYRTGLLWELFMSAPEVQDGLDILGFTY